MPETNSERIKESAHKAMEELKAYPQQIEKIAEYIEQLENTIIAHRSSISALNAYVEKLLS